MSTQSAFPTLIYRDRLLAAAPAKALNRQILTEVEDLAELDQAGLAWSKKHYRNGFTTYASANELHRFSPTFQRLEKILDRHVAKFTRELDFDLGAPLKMNTCWVNVMRPNTHHGLHLHPLSVISGTYYVQTPKGSSGLKFEDPRLSLLMHTPPKKVPSRERNRHFLEIPAEAGRLVLFESWLRHEVPLHPGPGERVSVSFNYGWE